MLWPHTVTFVLLKAVTDTIMSRLCLLTRETRCLSGRDNAHSEWETSLLSENVSNFPYFSLSISEDILLTHHKNFAMKFNMLPTSSHLYYMCPASMLQDPYSRSPQHSWWGLPRAIAHPVYWENQLCLGPQAEEVVLRCICIFPTHIYGTCVPHVHNYIKLDQARPWLHMYALHRMKLV